MKRRRYIDILQETGKYKTPDDFVPPWYDRLFGRFDWWYYFRLYIILIKAIIIARKPGRYTDECWRDSASEIMALVEGCGGKAEIEANKEFMECDVPKVIVGNHMSMLDTFLLPPMSLIDRHGVMVIKRSLWAHRFFGVLMKEVGAIPVDRVNPRDDFLVVMKEGVKALKAGNNMIIYPQSTREPVFHESKFNSMGVKLAVKAGAKIIPIALKADFQGIGKKTKDIAPLDRSKTVRLKFGPVLSPTKENAREVHEKCVEFISSTLKEWGFPVESKESSEIKEKEKNNE